MVETHNGVRPEQKFVQNCWYMAAWVDEVQDQPISRRLLDMQIAFFRLADGTLAALEDRCSHRFAPLSRGRVTGQMIQCGYHGLQFDGQGHCLGSPLGIAIPPNTHVRSFLVTEKYGCIWFWPGDPTKADSDKIPDFSYLIDPAFRVVRGQSFIKAHYELVTDNLLDLTHTYFLHQGFGGEAFNPHVSFSQEGETVYSHYDLPSSPPNEFTEGLLPSHGQDIRERDTIRWDAPGCLYLRMDMGIAADPDGPTVPQLSSHILTPETEETTHYFWASGVLQNAPMSDEFHYEALKQAFETEDTPMLEACQIAMEGRDFWDLQPTIIEYDKASIRARRIMRKHLHEEQSRHA